MTSPHSVPPEIQGWIARQLFEQVPSHIIAIDRDFRVVMANPAFEETFGETAGKFCYQAYKKRDRICTDCVATKTFEDGQVRIFANEQGVDKHGRPMHYVVHIVPVCDEAGSVTHVIKMSYDVTRARFLQREYDMLFERVPCYLSVLDRELRVVRANQMVRRTFGEPSGQHCFRLYKRRDSRCEDCPAVKTFSDGKSYTTKQLGMDKNGMPTCYVMSTARASPDPGVAEHVIEMAVDVTTAENLSAQLVREAQFRHHLTEGALDALVAADTSGVVNIFNPAAERLFKIAAAEVIGQQRAWEFLPAAFSRVILEGGPSLVLPETTVVTADGEQLPVRFSGTVLREGDSIIGGAAFLQDLREYKRMEQDKLDNERLAAVGETVAQLAHGIKNILTGIQGGMYALKSGKKSGSTERWEKGWAMLERNVSRITELVMGFLTFSRGHLPDVQPTDPAEVAESVYQLYRDAAEERGVTLRLEAAAGLLPANLDAEDIRTCLENLLSNAMDACEVAENESPVVTLRVQEQNEVISYEVADTGCGMDYEVKRKVFTTFFTTKGLGGTGLGLLVTRKIVQEHGGKISVESTPGRGSVFRIVLPRSRLPNLPAERGAPSRSVSEGGADE
jgi:PAS domain S-box-containing protein